MYTEQITKFKKLKKLFIILGSIALAFAVILLIVGALVYGKSFADLMYLVQEDPSKYYDSSTQQVIIENVPVEIINNIATGVSCLAFGSIFLIPGIALIVLAFALRNRKIKNYTALENKESKVVDAETK